MYPMYMLYANASYDSPLLYSQMFIKIMKSEWLYALLHSWGGGTYEN